MEDVEFVVLSYGVRIAEAAILGTASVFQLQSEEVNFFGNQFVLNALNLSFGELSRCVADDSSPSLLDQTLSSF